MIISFSGSPSLCFVLFCCYSIYVVLHSWLNILIEINQLLPNNVMTTACRHNHTTYNKDHPAEQLDFRVPRRMVSAIS